LRNWPKRFALACGIISLLGGELARAQGDLPMPVRAPSTPSGTPAIAVIDPSDAPQWENWSKELGWKVIVPPAPPQGASFDTRIQALDTAVQEAIKNGGVDRERIYLAGRGDTSAWVFYTVSRNPDPWAAAVALGGSPESALQTGRIFAINFTNVPVLWASASADDSALADKLKGSGLNLEWRSASTITNAAVFDWLRSHHRDAFPASIDCETNSQTFGRCYWIQMTKFDPTERNDVLPPTRLTSGSGASLDLGNFGFKPDDPGPGILISFLGEKYSGPLKMGDRILELEGKPIQSARQYLETMNKQVENRRAVIMIQRGKDRIRVETTIVVPKHDLGPTARVQARYDAETKQIEVNSRMLTEMKVTVPQQWLPVGLNWNGLSIEEINKPGCVLLKMEKELLHAAVCPPE